MTRLFCRKTLGLLTFLMLFWMLAYPQSADSSAQIQIPDIKTDTFFEKIEQLGHEEAMQSLKKFKDGRRSIHNRKILDEIDKTTQLARIALRKGVDTLSLNVELDRTQMNIDLARDGIFDNKGTAQTYRNLTTSSSIVEELQYRLLKRKEQLDPYTAELVDYKDRIDSLSSDSSIYVFPSDYANRAKYLQKLIVVARSVNPIDSALNHAILNLQENQARLDGMLFDLQSIHEEMDRYQQDLARHFLGPEFPGIWEEARYSRPFPEILRFSLVKATLALDFYLTENIFRLLLVLLMIGLATLFLHNLKKRSNEESLAPDDPRGHLLLRYPFFSAMVIVLSLFQFIFFNPPIIFSSWLWLLAAISLSILFRKYISNYWMRFWWIMILFFILAMAINTLLQASRTERWMMLALSAVGAIYGLKLLLRDSHPDLKEKRILYFIGFMVIMEISSFFANIFGRFNLSKALMISGFFGVIIAILFLWTIRLINEGLRVAAKAYKGPHKKLFYIDFNRIGEKVPAIFYVLLVFGWLLLLGRNFYAFRQLVQPLNNFLTEEITVGDYHFTVKGVFVFFAVILGAMLTSRVISLFADEPDVSTNPIATGSKPKATLGSWLLVARIIIISLGLFLAFAAAGIPLDRITIIFGALSVGIGLGLQGLVTNLVSGLIIAFEKPVNVGDMIEVHGTFGTMKSIGFRSSIIVTRDGSCLIIPNGDILSQHLVNWTMGKGRRRMNVNVGVAYGTDLEKVRNLLLSLLENHDKVMTNPAPVVILKEFNSSSIDVDLFFWVADLREAFKIKSEVIINVDTAFKQNNITIPFPQTDVHIKSEVINPDPAKD